jgi:hypothetical protein
MPDRSAMVSISSNNSILEKVLLDSDLHQDLKFSKHPVTQSGYFLFLIDLTGELIHVSQTLIEAYHRCREQSAKLIVVLLHGDQIDIEKNHYFQKMLDDLGKDQPIHRLVLTKDLYQTLQDSPATPLDHALLNTITSKKTTISQKGENVLYPLSLSDFVSALAKVYFLSGTSGKSFWFLGDPLTDLEFAYLLKNNLGTNDENFEINATEKNDPQTSSLSNLSNKTKAELNWESDDDFSTQLPKIVSLYSGKQEITQPSNSKISLLAKINDWYVKHRRPPKNYSLPKPKQIIARIILVLVGIYLLIGIVSAAAITQSLRQLTISVNDILNGNIQSSVGALDTSIKLESIGESGFSILKPPFGLLFPNYTQKIYNLFSFVGYTQSSLKNLQQTYNLAESLLSSLNSESSLVNYSDISLALHSNLSQIYENINQIYFLSEDKQLPSFLSSKIQNNPEFQNLKTLEEQIVQFIKLSDIIPGLLSNSGAKNILVLLQNSQILKPSGGDIDYFLLLTLDQGRLVSQKVYTPSELDTLYQSSSSANPKTKKLSDSLPKAKDLNSNPDFSITSQNISAYLEKALKTRPDFIIALNDTLFGQLLVEEKSVLSATFKNSYLEASGSSEIKSLSLDYLNRLFSHQLPLPVIGRSLAQAMTNNQIYLWSADNNLERLISLQSYSGVVTPHPCHTGLSVGISCLAQTSYLSENQSGTNRRSPWSSRLLKHNVILGNAVINHEYQVDYSPVSSSSSSISDSTLYQLYLSSPSTLDQIYLDGLPYSLKQVSKTTANSLDIYQIPLLLSLDQPHTLILRLSTPVTANFAEPNSYSLTEYRQPGTTDVGLNLKISYPESMRVTVLTQSVTTNPQSVGFTLPLHTTTFGFSLTKNLQ